MRILCLLFLVIFFSCKKLLDDKSNLTNSDSVFLLDSIKYSYPATSSFVSNTSIYVYNAKNELDNVRNITETKINPYIQKDTTYYIKSGNSFFSKVGINGILIRMGDINSQGFLIKDTTNQPPVFTFNFKTFLGKQYIDTNFSGHISLKIDQLGRVLSGHFKIYYTNTFTPNGNYPLLKSVRTEDINYEYTYTGKGVSSYVTNSNYEVKQIKLDGPNANWVFDAYSIIPNWSKNYLTYIKSSIKEFYPSYPYQLAENYLDSIVLQKTSTSKNNRDWVVNFDGIQFKYGNFVVDGDRIISFDQFDQNGNLIKSKKYFYNKIK